MKLVLSEKPGCHLRKIKPILLEHGFTLLELLIVLVIIGVIAALLLPSFGSANKKVRQIQCAANLSSLGKSIFIYTCDSGGYFPAAYIYRGMSVSPSEETPYSPTEGYVHWSGLFLRQKLTTEKALLCPAFKQGGLPPANTQTENLEDGQHNETPGVIDDQAKRCAFTVNQALFPANHFVTGFQGSFRPCRYVRDSSVDNPMGTVMATEWTTDWRLLSDDAGNSVCHSYLPVHGFMGLGQVLVNNRYDTRLFGCQRPCWAAMRRLTPADLSVSPSAHLVNRPRLDWVGRNHQSKGLIGSKSSNFLFADGHTENTTIFDVLQPFRWGQEFYSLQPGNDISE